MSGPFDATLAQVQADVGSLLQARGLLLSLQASAPVQVQDLLDAQTSLEAQLPGVSQASTVLYSAGFSSEAISAGATVAGFLASMELHLSRVNALAAQFGHAGLSTAVPSIPWAPVIGIVFGIGVLWLLLRRR